MGSYARALLRDGHGFGLQGLVDFAAEEGLTLRVEPASALTDAAWSEAELWADGAEVPVEVDVSRRGEPGSLWHDEVVELTDELDDAAERVPGAVARVRERLAASGAIVAVRVLASDRRFGPVVGTCVLSWYAQRDDVLFQADGQGFYDGDVLVVAT